MQAKYLVSSALISLFITAPAAAQNNSAPTYESVDDTIPAARDIPYPGTMRLDIDARDTNQAVFKVRQTIPVAKAGRMTLLYPEWLPGNHAPRGEIEKLVALKITSGGRPLRWTRDATDVYAFHINVPSGVKNIVAEFQFVSATDSKQGRVVMAPNMLNLRWHAMSLYPAGYYIRQIPVQANVTYPDDWKAATALAVKGQKGATVSYQTTDYDTLVDSPVFAGRYFAKLPLTDKVNLNIVADGPQYLVSNKQQIALHRDLVNEAVALFGGQQYDHYDFLLALTEEMGGIGIEHHRSSENGVGPDYFTKWNDGPGRRNLLPHEMVHSWNGKYRRPAGMWTPDFREPMRDNLLWVYEGQTQFWGYVLGARSGLFSKQDTLDAIAAIAAGLDRRVGRTWRPLADTTHDPIVSARRPKPWSSWQRSEDYYNEGLLIWLEADAIIRRESGGRKGLEDFARIFFGGREGDYGVVTYDFDDVVRTLSQVQSYNWAQFLRERVNRTNNEAPKNGITMGGYQLVYGNTKSPYIKSRESRYKSSDHSHSIGLAVSNNGNVSSVVWDGPAFNAGLTNGTKIVAVNDIQFSATALSQTIAANKGQKDPIRILTKSGSKYRTFTIDYSGGLRYPRLEKTTKTTGGIDMLLKAKTK